MEIMLVLHDEIDDLSFGFCGAFRHPSGNITEEAGNLSDYFPKKFPKCRPSPMIRGEEDVKTRRVALCHNRIRGGLTRRKQEDK